MSSMTVPNDSFMSGALVITRRELRDQVRDWRILGPVAVLTLFFPLLMNFTANQAVQFVQQYGADIVGQRLVPFLLMVVGFFPISVSLVIALESFAGERERLTLEPLLAAPLSDGQLYFGKLLASLFIPLLAAYLGIAVYLVGLALTISWYPPPQLLIQILLLTAVQALVMVSGAVVVSSQTTSVRAANLLASFIIVPMSQLIIGESLIMFWGRYHVLWWIVFGLLTVSILLARMGLHQFNREELLGREIDMLDLRWVWERFKSEFKAGAGSLTEWSAGVLRSSLPALWKEATIVSLVLAAGYLIGARYSELYQIPAELVQLDRVDARAIANLREFGLFSTRGWMAILSNNLRAVALASVLGMFTFGILALLLFMVPIALVGYLAGNVALAGGEAATMLTALVLPHAIVEIPAAILAGASILKLGLSVVSPPQGRSLGESWLAALAAWWRINLALVLPMLIVAAALEVFVTPRVAIWMLGGA